MPREDPNPLQRAISHADFHATGLVDGGCGKVADLLRRVLYSLTICRAERASLHSPAGRDIPGGWFCAYFVRSGACDLMLGEATNPIRIRAGNVLVLPRCKEHRLCDAPRENRSTSSHDTWHDKLPSPGMHRVHEVDRSDATVVLVCRFYPPGRECNLLIDKLPEYLVFQRHHTESASGQELILEVLERELTRQPVCQPIIEHLIKAVVLQITRGDNHGPSRPQGICHQKLADSVIARAVALMHSRIEALWTVATLAAAVGISRSSFAARFVNQVGMTPLNYLRQERMQRAVELLSDESLGIKEVAILVGYRSEAAFNSTFKRWSGLAPGLFRRSRQQLELPKIRIPAA